MLSMCIYIMVVCSIVSMDNSMENCIRNVCDTLFPMYGLAARPLIECGFSLVYCWFFVVPLVPNRNCSRARLLPLRGKFCS